MLHRPIKASSVAVERLLWSKARLRTAPPHTVAAMCTPQRPVAAATGNKGPQAPQESLTSGNDYYVYFVEIVRLRGCFGVELVLAS
jgi:hypothetical protein